MPRVRDLPTSAPSNAPAPPLPPPAGDTQPPAPPAALPEPTFSGETVLLEVPLGSPPATDFPVHVDRKFTRRQARALRRLTASLDARQERLENGRRVTSCGDALSWLLERISPKPGAPGAAEAH